MYLTNIYTDLMESTHVRIYTYIHANSVSAKGSDV
jgi:hypothetical protein